jgi:hypothetical protein
MDRYQPFRVSSSKVLSLQVLQIILLLSIIHFCSRIYIPTQADIGHVLRVECKAVKKNGDHVICKHVDTNIVLPCRYSQFTVSSNFLTSTKCKHSMLFLFSSSHASKASNACKCE